MFQRLKSKTRKEKEKEKEVGDVQDTGAAVVAVRPKNAPGQAKPPSLTTALLDDTPSSPDTHSPALAASPPVASPTLPEGPRTLRLSTSVRRSSTDESTAQQQLQQQQQQGPGPSLKPTSTSSTPHSEQDSPAAAPAKRSTASKLASLFSSSGSGHKMKPSGKDKDKDKDKDRDREGACAGGADAVEALGSGEGAGATGWLDGFNDGVKQQAHQGRGSSVPSRSIMAQQPDGTGRAMSSNAASGPADGTYRSGSLKATPIAHNMRRNAIAS